MENSLLTINEICSILRIGKTKAYELIKQKKIKSIKIGKKIIIPSSELNNYIAKQLNS